MTHTDEERDALLVMIAAFLSRARVGGKKGTGHGLLEPVKGWGSHVGRARDAALIDEDDAIARAAIERFSARATERAADLRTWLDEVKA